MTAAIATVVFNTDRFIQKQYELYSKHVRAEFIIVDNSTDWSISEKIGEFARKNGIRLIKTYFEERDFSRSHGMACNAAYYNLFQTYDLILFSDHDLFPVKDLDLSFMEDKVIAGVPQEKGGQIYLWAGLVVVNNKLVDKNALDFMPSQIEQFDTGGELHKIFRQLPKDKYHLFAERPDKEVTRIYFDVAETEHPSFIHIRNGSNWQNEEGHAERVEKLMAAI